MCRYLRNSIDTQARDRHEMNRRNYAIIDRDFIMPSSSLSLGVTCIDFEESKAIKALSVLFLPGGDVS